MFDKRLREIFRKKPVFGMIHLAHSEKDNAVNCAIKELTAYEAHGLDGAIIENYHGSVEDVLATVDLAHNIGYNLILGINILPNEFELALRIAHTYRLDFIQLDMVAGRYVRMDGSQFELDVASYELARRKYPSVAVFGGVHPKYYHTVPSSSLEQDVRVGMQRAEAIVVTGAGTGQTTPLSKIDQFRRILGKHPLIVGAGTTPLNIRSSLEVADGAIVGSSLKQGNNTSSPLDSRQIHKYMEKVRAARY